MIKNERVLQMNEELKKEKIEITEKKKDGSVYRKIETGDEQNQKKRQKTYQHDENGKDPVFHGKHKGMFDGGSDILVKVSECREQETSHSRRKKSNTQQNYLPYLHQALKGILDSFTSQA